MVHRLDIDTSGVVVFGKTSPAAGAVAAQFRAHAVSKEYLALVHGTPPLARFRVEAALGPHPNPLLKERRAVRLRGGRPVPEPGTPGAGAAGAGAGSRQTGGSRSRGKGRGGQGRAGTTQSGTAEDGGGGEEEEEGSLYLPSLTYFEVVATSAAGSLLRCIPATVRGVRC